MSSKKTLIFFLTIFTLFGLCNLSNAGELVYSTFLGGSNNDYGTAIAVDTFGNTYITGNTNSGDYPITAGSFDTSYEGYYYDATNAFVTKINASGSAIVYSTYLGGHSQYRSSWFGDGSNAIAVDREGNAYITGYTSSIDFPVTSNAFQTIFKGGVYWTPSVPVHCPDAFISKLNADGTGLIYSTFLGGSDSGDWMSPSDDVGNAIAVDTSGNIYVTGWTECLDFPTTPGAYDTTAVAFVPQGFVCKIDPSLSGSSSLQYSTIFEPSNTQRGICVDSAGNTYIAHDSFIIKFNSTASARIYRFGIDGSVMGLAIDNSGNAYLTGYTQSSDFPVTADAIDTTFNGASDIFVAKLNNSGSALLYSTYLGGISDDYGRSIAIDKDANIYITGYTTSTDFPITSGVVDSTYNGNIDIIITKLNTSSNSLLYSTYFGGTSVDEGNSIAVDDNKNIYITGYTSSATFPVTINAVDTAYNGNNDAFIVKFSSVIASFYAIPLISTAPLLVQFYDTSYGGSTSWSWSFGDGYFSSLQNPAHTYLTNGMYTVTLVASNALGTSTETKNNYIVVNTPPLANFYGTPTIGYPPMSVQFTDTSFGYPTSWSWTFGDGSTSTQQNPIHSYNNNGNYTVTLIVRNIFGSDTVTKSNYIVVGPAPVVNFYGSPTIGLSPVPVNFYDTSSGSITSWLWQFGDGSTSAVQNPSHTYFSPMDYTVKLVASNLYGVSTMIKSSYIHVYSIPTASFYATPTSGSTPLTVNFYDTSVGNKTNWFWSFGDGSTSTLRYPTHQYLTAGNYTVTLVVSNPYGTNTSTKSNYIHAYSIPTADFYAIPTSGGISLPVNFYDTSLGNPTTWLWLFGDGSTSTDQNPTHNYLAPINYSVTLIVSNSNGVSTTVKSDYIHGYAAPTASFYASPTNGASPLSVQFYDTSYGNPTSWSWAFGDGSTGTQQNPTHIYTRVSMTTTYTVQLIVNNVYGTNTVTKTNYIQATPPTPTANFYSIRTSGIAPLLVQFYDTSIDSPTSWSWTFGDGYGSDLQNPVNMYLSPGNYTVTLIASNVYGADTATKPNYIQVYGIVTADFYGTPTTGETPLSVQFYDTSFGNATSWNWAFGDGKTSSEQNPIHLYTQSGSFTVSLAIANQFSSDSKAEPGYIVIPTALQQNYWMLYQ